VRGEGSPARLPKNRAMSDLAIQLIRKSVGAMQDGRARCSSCRRTPLVGETVHVLASDEAVCSLCLDAALERDGTPVRVERVHAAERPLAVAPRAA
jgi:hypothetical protein